MRLDRLTLPIALVAAGAAAYAGACMVVYSTLTRVPGTCRPEWRANRPPAFTVPPARGDGRPFETAAYAMPEPEDVRFPSRDPEVTIAGWWLPAGPDAPAVILVHGLTACRHDHAVLLPAGMLHRHGYSVLLIDLRDHGDSTIGDRRHAGGTDEYADVLGAWDWLVGERGIDAARIGLLGISLGAATVLIAMGDEPRVAAAWADSSYADTRVAIRAELERAGFPAILEWGGLAIAVWLGGHGLYARSPLAAMRHLDGRPIALAHGDADARVSVAYAFELAAEVAAGGGHVEPWIVTGAGHTEAMTLVPDEYERRLVAFFGAALGGPAETATAAASGRAAMAGHEGHPAG
jgi:dipeptidyl aminopeptidase/acylaminoacyl peptidase